MYILNYVLNYLKRMWPMYLLIGLMLGMFGYATHIPVISDASEVVGSFMVGSVSAIGLFESFRGSTNWWVIGFPAQKDPGYDYYVRFRGVITLTVITVLAYSWTGTLPPLVSYIVNFVKSSLFVVTGGLALSWLAFLPRVIRLRKENNS